ncbi:sigma-70 family RNA polymerase sigma factor [Ktedonosporobacter rubrisoli]|uniref:Sigma-70 family RNA polymerase sigma factor n=1 Tax=Ktedonosporobacter rubrisoli TaxID=2509675 RepID=A0A4P6K2Z8_KTERU|nr:sigma-70 family RNA polymerase sigma factor [Ktedonosporobacter rubrisoli]QBD82302.1 sigma-70 family RNA polymerase sigma factor [Ktedonosporobacter rubrisoli]
MRKTILKRDEVADVYLEVQGIVEFIDANDGCERSTPGVEHNISLAQIYDDLPVYGSSAFWQAIEAADLPLEVLVRCFRSTSGYGDIWGRNRLIEVILYRVQSMNERWAHSMLKNLGISADERYALACDLCADLSEAMFRALMDPGRRFWEENFLHCLRFERRHIYQAFMMREGRWGSLKVKRSVRIPRELIASLDRQPRGSEEEPGLIDIKDEKAELMLQAIEKGELLRLVMSLPGKLKAAVLLVFWEGRTEKEAARILCITDRTVRNRIREAVKLLRDALEMDDGGFFYG